MKSPCQYNRRGEEECKRVYFRAQVGGTILRTRHRDIDYGGAELSLEVKSRAGLVRFET
jgi:hypothetical protein